MSHAQASHPAVYDIHGTHAADRLLASQALNDRSLYLRGEPPPTPQQVCAVLHGLADLSILARLVSDDVKRIGRDRGLGDQWRHASGIGRYLRGMGDWIDGWGSSTDADSEGSRCPSS